VSSRALEGVDVVVHLASNPDIARAVTEPEIDFSSGTLLTNSVVEAARTQGVNTIVYASGSGVYGDLGDLEIPEDHGPLRPVSTYGASKLAGEALVRAYAHMFGLRGRAFRFANVVGPRQTHGVGYDFLNKLAGDPTRLEILGDGRQSKCYIAIADVLDAILGVIDEPGDLPYEVFNVSTDDALSVDEIAAAACRASGLDPAAVVFDHTAAGVAGTVMSRWCLDTSRIRSGHSSAAIWRWRRWRRTDRQGGRRSAWWMTALARATGRAAGPRAGAGAAIYPRRRIRSVVPKQPVQFSRGRPQAASDIDQRCCRRVLTAKCCARSRCRWPWSGRC
jgi:nucleoside-diphosphate-sugar epimerase